MLFTIAKFTSIMKNSLSRNVRFERITINGDLFTDVVIEPIDLFGLTPIIEIDNEIIEIESITDWRIDPSELNGDEEVLAKLFILRGKMTDSAMIDDINEIIVMHIESADIDDNEVRMVMGIA